MGRLAWIALLAVVIWAPAQAGIYDGIAAFKRGDYQTAYAELLPAAKAGHPVAQYYVGRMRDDGNGVARDREKAVAWYRKAAERGHADAQYRLGVLYLWGWGIEQSRSQALLWHLRAARQGHVDAQTSVGRLYARGAKGIAANNVEAWKWLTIASRGGSPQASLSVTTVEQRLTASELAKARRLAAKFRPTPE
ncbi:MAG: tetratricopeptide repeat protein [Alphaproteobacteria bacterium]|nr:tetratricopeptide repeat protein [Alphaproteobacteria bacterium]